MTDRKWLPSEWMDEMPPTSSKSPSDFLKRNTDGVLQLTQIDDDESSSLIKSIELGAEVAFTWYEHRGQSTLTIRDDWTWSIDPPFDADTNCYRSDDADSENIWCEMQDLVDDMRDNDGEPGTCEVEGWTWSDDVLFEVRVLDSGAAEFVPITIPDAGHPYGCEHPVASS